MKSVYIDNLYRPLLPSCKFTSIPSAIRYNVQRRGPRLLDRNSRNTLFLNAASVPSSQEEELVEIPSTSNTQTISAPYTQVLASLNTIDKSLSQKIDKLQNMGGMKYLDDELRNKDQKGHSHQSVSFPENTESIGANISMTTEPQTSAVKRKKAKNVSIKDHEFKSKRRRKTNKKHK